MEQLTLDRDALKALASDTRLEILKRLDERQKTVTELARELELNKATVFEHCERLLAADLIQKIEDDRKWVYYQLSWKGRRILHPERMTIALLLSTSLGGVVSGALAFALWWRSRAYATLGGGGPPVDDAAGAESATRAFDLAYAPAAQTLTSDPVLLGWAVFLLGAALLAGLAAWQVRAQARGTSAV